MSDRVQVTFETTPAMRSLLVQLASVDNDTVSDVVNDLIRAGAAQYQPRFEKASSLLKYIRDVAGDASTVEHRVCGMCGQPFAVGPRQGRRDKQYCSKNCQNWAGKTRKRAAPKETPSSSIDVHTESSSDYEHAQAFVAWLRGAGIARATSDEIGVHYDRFVEGTGFPRLPDKVWRTALARIYGVTRRQEMSSHQNGKRYRPTIYHIHPMNGAHA